MATNLRLQSAALVVLLLVSSIGAPTSAQFVDPKQPSVDNPHMHVYGNSDLSNCFMHFDGNDTTGSAEEGYGEQVWPEQVNQQIDMDYTCRISDNFKQDVYLNPNGTIQIKLDFQIDADGILSVSATETTTGNSSMIEVKPSYGLSESDISSMIEESNQSAEADMQLRRLNESIVEGKRVIYALEQALNSDGKELLSTDEYNIITRELIALKSSINGDDSELIEDKIVCVEKASEFYVERRMNSSIKSLIAGKGIDDIL